MENEYQTSWVEVTQSQYKWDARRLELGAGSDLVSLPFGLHCVSSVNSPYVVSPRSGPQEADPYGFRPLAKEVTGRR